MEFIYLIFREFTLNWYCYIHWHEKFQSALFIFRMVMVYRELILVIIATHIQNVVSLFVFYLIHIFSQFFFLRISHSPNSEKFSVFFPKNFSLFGECPNSDFLLVRVFTAFELNTGMYWVYPHYYYLHIHPECRKIWARKNYKLWHFLFSVF